MPELVFFRRGEEVLRVGLERERVVLGRGQDCDVVLPDPQVSRHHLALQWEGERCVLEDLSGQGTQVAGQPLRHGELRDGADLKLGQWTAVFRQRGSGGAERPTQPGVRTDVQPREALEDEIRPLQVRVKQGTTEWLHPIGPSPFTLGKAPDNALVIDDRYLSGRHLEVTRRQEGFHVRDLSSTNGTYHDGLRLYEAEVPLNTVLRVGQTELVFEAASPGAAQPCFHGLLGREPALRRLVEQLPRVAASCLAVSILGESGTGKELVARALHACSPRSQRPFIVLNCAALVPGVMESELFGHEKGAFTGAEARRNGAFVAAHGGTLFLDEVGELPLELQAKLLRVLESGEVKPVGADHPLHVDVRVVTATHRELFSAVRQGKFREDLYYRLAVVPLGVPSLRSRRADIPLLAEHFVREHAPRERAVKFTAAALARLQQHSWPGNVRELRNLVHRTLLLRKGPKIDAQDITFDEELCRAPEEVAPPPLELPEDMTLEQMIQRLERQLVESTLRRCHYHKDRTARQLGIARSALFRRLKQWGLNQGEG